MIKLRPIVEGYGEVEAIRILLRRLVATSQEYGVEIQQPFRKPRTQLVREKTFREVVRATAHDCDAILVIFDADDDCPKELAPQLENWAKLETIGIPCSVVIVSREYEAWFLASIESLRSHRKIRENASSHPDPELPRNAKKQLELRMKPGQDYVETTDQPALTQLFDLEATYKGCRSFRKLVKAFGDLTQAAGLPLQNWPPAAW